jgi:quercetin dioxygenase-like cupin family protein
MMRSRCMRYIARTVFILGIAGILGLSRAQTATPSALPVIDNERATVWQTTLNPRESVSMKHHDADVVTLFLSDGDLRVTDAHGASKVTTRKSGDVVFTRKDTEEREEVTSRNPMKVVVIELKNPSVPPLRNTTGYPLAFPRPGSKKVLENDRIVAWHYTWNVGVRTPMHYHDKDVVIVYQGDGVLKSVPLSGPSEENEHKTGEIRFNRANRTHYEVLEKGSLSAMIVELK